MPLPLWTREEILSGCMRTDLDEVERTAWCRELMRQWELRKHASRLPVAPGAPATTQRSAGGRGGASLAAALIVLALTGYSLSLSPNCVTWVAVGLLIVIPGALLFWALRTSGTRAEQRRARQGLCVSCGYDLRGLPRLQLPCRSNIDLGPPRCPECDVVLPLVPRLIHERGGVAAGWH